MEDTQTYDLKLKTDYLNKNSKGNLFILKHYLYSVSNFWPLGQEAENLKQSKVSVLVKLKTLLIKKAISNAY